VSEKPASLDTPLGIARVVAVFYAGMIPLLLILRLFVVANIEEKAHATMEQVRAEFRSEDKLTIERLEKRLDRIEGKLDRVSERLGIQK
jgi:hypothetical protein